MDEVGQNFRHSSKWTCYGYEVVHKNLVYLTVYGQRYYSAVQLETVQFTADV